MSKLYSTIHTDAGKTKKRTARAFSSVSAAVQSWEGSLIVKCWIEPGGKHCAAIEKHSGSDSCAGTTLWTGDLADIIGASSLDIRKPA